MIEPERSTALDHVARSLAARATVLSVDSPDLVVTRMQGKDAWRVEGGPQTLVLKRYRSLQGIEDVRWEHAFLTELARTGFSAPIPVPVLGGKSWLQIDGRTWGVLVFIPGRSLAWERAPGMDAAGALLAEYHANVRPVRMAGQRPTATPLRELRSLLDLDALRVGCAYIVSARELDDLFVTLDSELDALGFDACDKLIVHGDATTDNMVIDGAPPQLVGLIDFGSAHVERWPADLGAALWRSGRARPDDLGLDPQRVADFVRGYHRRSPLSPDLIRAVPVLIAARGLQLFVRRAQQVTSEQLIARRPLLIETLKRTRRVRDQHRELETAIREALHA